MCIYQVQSPIGRVSSLNIENVTNNYIHTHTHTHTYTYIHYVICDAIIIINIMCVLVWRFFLMGERALI